MKFLESIFSVCYSFPPHLKFMIPLESVRIEDSRSVESILSHKVPLREIHTEEIILSMIQICTYLLTCHLGWSTMILATEMTERLIDYRSKHEAISKEIKNIFGLQKEKAFIPKRRDIDD
eukprot:TRINITY_DN3860_c0_g1_i4.p2 TRINITY_DN3860_c0_g1~~TRINITY_DN3860_c0_g1_i4.p2  ORF type:complete len:120 (+),score=11.69 TRINITY_DN3860_c0_g1_i4:1028-1387(+)